MMLNIPEGEMVYIDSSIWIIHHSKDLSFKNIFQEGMHGIITQMPDLETFSATIDKYHLLPRNATHLSIIFSLNIPNIVTTDADFDKVKEIKVWKP